MKKTLLTIVVILTASVLANGQDKTSTQSYEKEGKTFVQKDTNAVPFKGDVVTDYVWKDTKGNTYPIILHTYTKGEKEGRVVAYVIRTSAKSGKDYRYYLPDGEDVAKEILAETH